MIKKGVIQAMPKVNNIFSWEALPNDVIKDSDLRSIQEVSGGPMPCPGKRAKPRQQISLEQFRAAHGWFSESSWFTVYSKWGYIETMLHCNVLG